MTTVLCKNMFMFSLFFSDEIEGKRKFYDAYSLSYKIL